MERSDSLEKIQQPLFGYGVPFQLTINDAIARAISCSSQIAVFQFTSLESRQLAGKELGRFDVNGFVESKFGQGNTPVGNQFQVGDVNQFAVNSQETEVVAGVRRQTVTGGQLSLGQQVRFFDDNSGILVPPDQAISQLSLNFSQELLRDSGRKVVLNRVLVATVESQRDAADTVERMADHLNQVASAYWTLYSERGKVAVIQEQIQLVRSVVDVIKDRAVYDSNLNLVYQAKSQLLQLEVELQQSIATTKQNQDRLLRLIGDESLMHGGLEVVTLESPILEEVPIDLESEVATAVEHRGEIQKAFAEIESAKLKHYLSLNQLLPRLTLLLDASLNGLDGERDISTAFGNQFGASPTYEVGLNFEIPLNVLNQRLP